MYRLQYVYVLWIGISCFEFAAIPPYFPLDEALIYMLPEFYGSWHLQGATIPDGATVRVSHWPSFSDQNGPLIMSILLDVLHMIFNAKHIISVSIKSVSERAFQQYITLLKMAPRPEDMIK